MGALVSALVGVTLLATIKKHLFRKLAKKKKPNKQKKNVSKKVNSLCTKNVSARLTCVTSRWRNAHQCYLSLLLIRISINKNGLFFLSFSTTVLDMCKKNNKIILRIRLFNVFITCQYSNKNLHHC